LGGAQEYFGIRADMVTYGKTLGGGLPIGALCGRRDLMRRYRPDRPADLCFARGTFNSHPYVMAAAQEFLQALDTPDIQAIYGASRSGTSAPRRSMPGCARAAFRSR
jgi:glutamate-1-semialdehyde 2,1-aminomutase